MQASLSVLLLCSVGCSGLAPNSSLYDKTPQANLLYQRTASASDPKQRALDDSEIIAEGALHQAQTHRNKFYFFSVAGFGIGLGGTLFSTLASADSTKKQSAQIATAVGSVITSLIGLYHWETQAANSQNCAEKITLARNALTLEDGNDQDTLKTAIATIYKIDSCSSSYVLQYNQQTKTQEIKAQESKKHEPEK